MPVLLFCSTDQMSSSLGRDLMNMRRAGGCSATRPFGILTEKFDPRSNDSNHSSSVTGAGSVRTKCLRTNAGTSRLSDSLPLPG